MNSRTNHFKTQPVVSDLARALELIWPSTRRPTGLDRFVLASKRTTSFRIPSEILGQRFSRRRTLTDRRAQLDQLTDQLANIFINDSTGDETQRSVGRSAGCRIHHPGLLDDRLFARQSFRRHPTRPKYSQTDPPSIF